MTDHATAITLTCETQTTHGWSYVAQICHGASGPEQVLVRLSHADYEFWCGGIEPPAAVAERGVRIVIESLQTLPASFDLAAFRRRITDFDDRMRHA